jgi:hypothetical protein
LQEAVGKKQLAKQAHLKINNPKVNKPSTFNHFNNFQPLGYDMKLA